MGVFTVNAAVPGAVRIENSFIAVDGVGPKTEQRLWNAGILDWDSFYNGVVGPKTERRICEFVDEAVDRLAQDDARFFAESFPSSAHWRMYENFSEQTCFLDIETTGLDHRFHETTVVTFHQAGSTTTLTRGIDLTRERIRDVLAEATLLVTFNGKRFDVPFLEHEFDLSIDHPHIDLLHPCRRLNLHGGLKEVERVLGIDRDEPDIGGRDAVRLWREFERGDESALDRLTKYNRDDTVHLETVVEEVCTRLDRRVFGSVETLQGRL